MVSTNAIAEAISGTKPNLSEQIGFRLEVRSVINGRPFQRYTNFYGGSFVRSWNGSFWTTWSRADLFGNQTLSELASALGVTRYVFGCNYYKRNITAEDAAVVTIDKHNNNGLLIIGAGGSNDYRPGIYSISRYASVDTIHAASTVTSVTTNETTITINRSTQGRMTVVWIEINT